MSVGWYYMASGWLRKARRVGPISESDLLAPHRTGKNLSGNAFTKQQDEGKMGSNEHHWSGDEALDGAASGRTLASQRLRRTTIETDEDGC